MPATIEFVSHYVRQQVRQLALAQPQSYAMHAYLISSYYLDQVVATKPSSEGRALRERAEGLRTSLFEPPSLKGAVAALEPLRHTP